MNSPETDLYISNGAARHDRRRWWSIIVIVLASRALVWDHPTPVHGDEDRFAAGASFLWLEMGGSPDRLTSMGLSRPDSYSTHHPGYLLWTLSACPLMAAGVSPYLALRLWSLLASVADTLLLFALARSILGGRRGFWVALGLAVAPLHWFCSVSGLNYVAGSMVASGTALLLWPVWRTEHNGTSDRRDGIVWRTVIPAVLVCGLGAGIRPDALVWMTPLILVTAWRCGKRYAVFALAGLVASFAAWSLVTGMVYSAGNGETAPQLSHTLNKVLATSVFKLGVVDGLARNVAKWTLYVAWGAGLPTVLLLLWRLPRVMRNLLDQQSIATFLTLWMLPPLLFNWLLHMAEPGYTIWHLAPMLIAAGLADGSAGDRRVRRLLPVAVIATASLFLAYPWSVQSKGWIRVLNAKAAFMSLDGLQRIDHRSEIHQPGDTWRTPAHDLPG